MTEPASIAPTIPKELEDLTGSVKALATAHNLLDQGYFPQVKHQAIKMCMAYLKSLYEQALTDAFAHPAWELSEELKVIKEQRAVDEKYAREEAQAKAAVAVEEALSEQA